MPYPGGKGAAYQHHINLIPPHHVYLEPFAGHAAVFFNKRPAAVNILVEKNQQTILDLIHMLAERGIDAQPYSSDKFGMDGFKGEDADGNTYAVYNGCGLHFLESYFSGSPVRDAYVFADPPYVMSARSSQRPIYLHEFGDEDHRRLLHWAGSSLCKMQICGYTSALYDILDRGWNTYTYQAMTRGGRQATETIWYNYPEPSRLHDYQHLGDDYRERERIKRKAQRWVAGLERLPALERRAILARMELAGLI